MTAVTEDMRVATHLFQRMSVALLFLGGELLAERCRTDDLLPSIPISCLPPCCMDPKVLRLNILIYCSQPGGSWSSNGSLLPVCWWLSNGEMRSPSTALSPPSKRRCGLTCLAFNILPQEFSTEGQKIIIIIILTKAMSMMLSS